MNRFNIYKTTILKMESILDKTNLVEPVSEEPILILNKIHSDHKQNKPEKHIGYRLGCDHYLEFRISDEVKSVISKIQPSGSQNTNVDVCKNISNLINLSNGQQLMFIYGQSRYYHDNNTKCDILLLDYTKTQFTTRRGDLSRVIVEKNPYINSLDEIKNMLISLHKVYKLYKSLQSAQIKQKTQQTQQTHQKNNIKSENF